jgi:hypothetical protein
LSNVYFILLCQLSFFLERILNNNPYAQTRERFLDAGEEPRRMLQPIEGYQHLPLVSLEESIESIVSLCPDICRRVYIAKENCQNLSDNSIYIVM